MSNVFVNLVDNACRWTATGWNAAQNAVVGVPSQGAIALGSGVLANLNSYALYNFSGGINDSASIYKDMSLPVRLDGTTYTMGAVVWHNFSGPVSAYPIVHFTYTDSNGVTQNGSRWPGDSSIISPLSPLVWTRLSGVIDFSTVEGAVLSSVVITGFGVVVQTFPGNLPAGQLRVTALHIVENTIPSQPYGGDYFDGSFPDTATLDYSWLGTAQQSHSVMVQSDIAPIVPLSAPTITPDPPAPVPGVVPRKYSPINLSDYSVLEDSTPVDPSDTTGGVGQSTLSTSEIDDTRFLLDLPVELSVVSQGKTTGTVRGLSSSDGAATIVADSRLGLLNATRTAQPFVGTLSGAFTYYLSLVDITDGLVVDSTVASNPVVFPGWSGNVWDQMKKMALSQKCEVSLVSNNAVLRPFRLREAENYRDSAHAWNLDTSQLAQSVEIYYYQNTQITNALVYPVGGWNTEVPVFTVNAGETQTYDIPLDASLSSVQQPVVQDFVDRYYSSSSVYAVTGNDGLPYLAAQWTAEGGSVTVAVNEDTRSLTVTVVGASGTQYAPYSIAVASGPSDRYSSLRLVGSGVAYNKQLLTFYTSVDPDRVSVEVGATIDNEFITSADQAVELARWALKRWGAPKHTITVTTNGINRLGDNGSYAYPTVEMFNDLYAGQLVSNFNSTWSGMTVEEFNEFMVSLVSDEFANQAFGNIAGARVRFGDAYFRIRTATNSSTGITYTAEEDTVVGDFDEVWAGATVGDFNAYWLGKDVGEFNLSPLRRD